MKPTVKEFHDDQSLISEVRELSQQGIPKENFYIISHDKDRTDRLAEKVNANEVGVKEEGLKVALENIFQKEGDELRAKLQEMDFSENEANELEEKLDHGKVLLLMTDSQG